MKNKQLFIGLAIGVLIMLPLGVYANNRNNSQQAEQPSTTLETKADNDNTPVKTIEPVVVQPQTQDSSQPCESNAKKPNSNSNTQNNTPQQPYIASVCTKTPVPHETLYRESTYLYPHQSFEALEGIDGIKHTCTADSNGNFAQEWTDIPLTRIVRVGTLTYSPKEPTYELAKQRAESECMPVAQEYGHGSGGDELCIQAITAQLFGN